MLKFMIYIYILDCSFFQPSTAVQVGLWRYVLEPQRWCHFLAQGTPRVHFFHPCWLMITSGILSKSNQYIEDFSNPENPLSRQYNETEGFEILNTASLLIENGDWEKCQIVRGLLETFARFAGTISFVNVKTAFPYHFHADQSGCMGLNSRPDDRILSFVETTPISIRKLSVGHVP